MPTMNSAVLLFNAESVLTCISHLESVYRNLKACNREREREREREPVRLKSTVIATNVSLPIPQLKESNVHAKLSTEQRTKFIKDQ